MTISGASASFALSFDRRPCGLASCSARYLFLFSSALGSTQARQSKQGNAHLRIPLVSSISYFPRDARQAPDPRSKNGRGRTTRNNGCSKFQLSVVICSISRKLRPNSCLPSRDSGRANSFRRAWK